MRLRHNPDCQFHQWFCLCQLCLLRMIEDIAHPSEHLSSAIRARAAVKRRHNRWCKSTQYALSADLPGPEHDGRKPCLDFRRRKTKSLDLDRNDTPENGKRPSWCTMRILSQISPLMRRKINKW